MGFHIDATDRPVFRVRHRYGFAPPQREFWLRPRSVSASTSFLIREFHSAEQRFEIHVDTDLTGEVFTSRATISGRTVCQRRVIGQIQQNTPVPSANPLGDTPAAGGTIGAYESPRARPRPVNAPSLPAAGIPLREPPAQPEKPNVERHVDAPKGSRWYDESAHPEDAGKGAPETPTPPAGDQTETGEKAPDGDKKAAEPAPDAAKPAATGKKADGLPKPKAKGAPDGAANDSNPAPGAAKSLDFRPLFRQGVFA
jgi:hypothetical protein